MEALDMIGMATSVSEVVEAGTVVTSGVVDGPSVMVPASTMSADL